MEEKKDPEVALHKKKTCREKLTSPYFVWASQMPLRLITGNTFGSRELDLKIQSFVLAQKEGQKRLTEKKICT